MTNQQPHHREVMQLQHHRNKYPVAEREGAIFEASVPLAALTPI